MKFKRVQINIPEISQENKKRIKISFAILFIFFSLAFFVINQFPLTGKIVDTEGYKITPLNSEQREKVEQSILASSFVKDIPEKDPVFLRFFSFESGERVWQDGFLVGSEGILTQGNPSVYLSINAKYISELNGQDLCEIIQRASRNGDVGLHSDYGKIRLFLKYAKMLKHRGCLGF